MQKPTIEAAPGKHIAPPALSPSNGPARPAMSAKALSLSNGAAAEPSRYMLAEVVPLGGGTFRLMPRPMHEWMGLSQAALAKVGIALSENTLRRLGRAKFIEVRQISPNRYEFSYASWLEHCRRVQEDPEFWETKDELPGGFGGKKKGKSNREKYLEALS